MSLRIVVGLVFLTLCTQSLGQANGVGGDTQEKAAAVLRARIEASPELPFHGERSFRLDCATSKDLGIMVCIQVQCTVQPNPLEREVGRPEQV